MQLCAREIKNFLLFVKSLALVCMSMFYLSIKLEKNLDKKYGKAMIVLMLELADSESLIS